MSFVGRMKASFGESASVSSSDSWIIRAIGGGKTHAGTMVSEHTALSLPVVYSAVGILADAKAQLPIDVYQNINGKRQPRPEHPVAQLLSYQPNRFMTPFTLGNTMQQHVVLWGNGYAEIQRDEALRPVGLWPLLPDRTGPVKENDSYRYRTSIDGQYFWINPEDTLHIPAMGFDGIVGYSPIYMARQALGLAMALEEFGAKFFKNDAKSGGFIQHPGVVGEKAKKNIADSLNKDQSGLDNAHRVRVLEEGAKFVQTTIPPEDAQFLGTRQYQVEEIARLYRIPLHMLQSHSKDTAWGSGIEQMVIGFIYFTLMPWLIRWEQEINRKLFTEQERKQGFYVKHNLNAILRGDAASRASFYRSAISAGWMLKNEAREKEDMNPIEGLDAQESNNEISTVP